MLYWQAVLAELHRRQVSTLLIEGGAHTAASALQSGVVDKVFAFVAPTILGPGHSFSGRLKPRRLADAIGLRRTTVTRLGEDTLIEGYVHRAG
jgi:diaminohydroxyphosphoribosylaminopyrimidine deaminase/5-amino-6-(5-phosphoribosylamino)uracil reductase